MKIQFGSGGNQLEGWNNHDAEVDITKPLPYESESVQEVLLEHCGEHCAPQDFFRFLIEARRILKSGGLLHISCPVVDRLEPDHARDILLGHGHLSFWTEQSLASFLSLAGFRDIARDIDGDGKRPAIYGHWRVIGEAKDELESARFRLTK